MQMTLMEYITQHFNGDLHRYAQSEGVSREQIINWIDNECHVIKGRICPVNKRSDDEKKPRQSGVFCF